MIRNLLAAVRRLKKPAAAAASPAKRAGPKIVFVIDDNPDSLRAMRLALADEKYRLETADSAEVALRKLSTFQPDLILLDTQVPATDGTELARRLLADEELASIPIVALTETVTGPHRPESTVRFDGRIEKPGDPGALPGQVRAFLESPWQAPNYAGDLHFPAAPTADRRQQIARLLEAIEAGLPDSQFAPGTRSGLHQLAGVVGGLQHYVLADYLQQAERLSTAATVRARSRFRLVIRFCRELLHREPDVVPGLADLRTGYLDHRRTELNTLADALNRGNFAALGNAGHNLKGTGAAYGFAELTDIGRALEAAAKEDDTATVEVLLDQLESYISIVRPSPAR